jgi:hypothetical protein
MAVNPGFFEELKRRNVLKVATAFAVASFVILQICDIVFPAIGLSDDAIGFVINNSPRGPVPRLSYICLDV